MRLPLSKMCVFIQQVCSKYKIDESHGMKHALDVYKFSRILVASERTEFPYIINQIPIIYTAALLHDTCDKKYMDEIEGVINIQEFLGSTNCYNREEMDTILKIIQTMSYSKVKIHGFPELGIYQKAYHIVREADLLTAYDFDRGLLYTLNNYDVDYKKAFYMAKKLYGNRMAKHIEDGLISTPHGIEQARLLLKDNLVHIDEIENMLLLDVDI